MSTRPDLRSVLFNRTRLSWLLGVGLLINESFIVPPADFRISLVIIGGLLAGVPGLDIARSLWGAGAPPPEPPVPPSPSALPPSPSGTPSSTSGA